MTKRDRVSSTGDLVLTITSAIMLGAAVAITVTVWRPVWEAIAALTIDAFVFGYAMSLWRFKYLIRKDLPERIEPERSERLPDEAYWPR